jgi:hypothetical protein
MVGYIIGGKLLFNFLQTIWCTRMEESGRGGKAKVSGKKRKERGISTSGEVDTAATVPKKKSRRTTDSVEQAIQDCEPTTNSTEHVNSTTDKQRRPNRRQRSQRAKKLKILDQISDAHPTASIGLLPYLKS